MCWRAIDFLAGNLKTGDRVFEYGSGGSTLFLASLGVELVSIEHDEGWYNKVSNSLVNSGLPTVDYRFVPPGDGECRIPGRYKSSVPLYKNANFANYVNTIMDFPDGWFDMLIIDGRARVDCARVGLSKVKTGGYVVLDNSKRKRYSEIWRLVGDSPKREFEGTTPKIKVPNVVRPYTTVWTISRNE